MAQKEITISGVGGQGMILCGTLIAKAAAIYDRKKATLSSEYGVETRGTFAKSDVIVSDEEIYFPKVTKPNFVVCLHQIAYQRYVNDMPEGSYIIYDQAEVVPEAVSEGRDIPVDISGIAREVGHKATANIITMGLIIAISGVISMDAAKKIIEKHFEDKGQKIVQLNIKALEMGYEEGKELVK